jgi:plastocyanin
MDRRLTGSIVVCAVAAAFAAGALLIEPDGAGSPAAAADAAVPSAATNPPRGTGAYGGKQAGANAPATTGRPANGQAAAPAVLTISGFAFGQLTTAPGAAITVVNRDGEDHTVTADGKAFNVAVAGGAQGRLTAPAKPGTYSFFCAIHPSMQGRLVVR